MEYRILAMRSRHLELVRILGRKIPARGFGDDCLKAAARKNLFVRLDCFGVKIIQILRVAVETVQILHGKLAAAEQPGFGARLVAEFILNLIQIGPEDIIREIKRTQEPINFDRFLFTK